MRSLREIRLERRVAAQESHIRNLEKLLGINEPLPDWLDVPSAKRVTVIVNLLLKRQFASNNSIRMAVGCTPDAVRVYLNGVRKFLRQHGIELRNSWGSGWSIADADKAKLREVIGRDEHAA